MDLEKFDEIHLLEKPLSYLKEFLSVIENHIKQYENENEDKKIQVLQEAVKRTFYFKYNLIKKDILNGIVAEIEQQALLKIKEACNQYVHKRQIEIDESFAKLEEEYKNYLNIVHSEEDIAFVKSNSKTVNEFNNKKKEYATIYGIEYIINKTMIEFLEKTKDTITEKIEEIKKMQELVEPFLKEKQYLGICTIIPVKKQQTHFYPLVQTNQIPDELKEEVVYKKLSNNKIKKWIEENPSQSLFLVKQKDYYIRIINNITEI